MDEAGLADDMVRIYTGWIGITNPLGTRSLISKVERAGATVGNRRNRSPP